MNRYTAPYVILAWLAAAGAYTLDTLRPAEPSAYQTTTFKVKAQDECVQKRICVYEDPTAPRRPTWCTWATVCK